MFPLTILMKVEAIEPTRSQQGKLRLRFDDGSTVMVLPSVIAELGLYEGIEIPDGAMQSVLETAQQASAKERAVRIISASSVTKRELFHRLIQKGETEEHAQEAVAWLEELNLLNDRAVAENVVRSGLAKGYGEARIRQMLYEKRVPKALWDEVLADLPEQDNTIDEFLQRRFRGKTPDRADCKRAADALIRRGHTWSDIKKALGRYVPYEDE